MSATPAVPFYGRKVPDGRFRYLSTRKAPIYVTEQTASYLSSYNHAIGQLMQRGGDKSAIDRFIGAQITDVNGNSYELASDEKLLRKLNLERAIDYAKDYRSAA